MRSEYVDELRAALRAALETLERAVESEAAGPPPSMQEKCGSTTQSEFLTQKEFLALLGISYSTYRHLRAEGKMPPEIRLTARTIKISRADVEAWERGAARRVA